MRFEPGELETQTTMRALLEDPDYPGRPAVVYWVVRPLEPILQRPGHKLSVVSFFALSQGALACLDWQIWSFLQTCPAPLFGVRGGSSVVQPVTPREHRFAGLVLPAPLHPVQLIEHVSEVLWNDRNHLRHKQL